METPVVQQNTAAVVISPQQRDQCSGDAGPLEMFLVLRKNALVVKFLHRKVSVLTGRHEDMRIHPLMTCGNMVQRGIYNHYHYLSGSNSCCGWLVGESHRGACMLWRDSCGSVDPETCCLYLDI